MGRRYNEFKAIKNYINSIISYDKVVIPSDRPIPRFPGSAVVMVNVNNRKIEFERYLSYFLRNGALDNENIVALLMGFLEVSDIVFHSFIFLMMLNVVCTVCTVCVCMTCTSADPFSPPILC